MTAKKVKASTAPTAGEKLDETIKDPQEAAVENALSPDSEASSQPVEKSQAPVEASVENEEFSTTTVAADEPAPFPLSRTEFVFASPGGARYATVRHPRLKQWQKARGIEESGEFDSITEASVIELQEAHDLPVTGVIDEETWRSAWR